MLEPLTDLERGILEYLIEYLRHNTYQPSIREIGRRFGIKSTKTVSEHLQSLADKGWVERDPARSRGIRVLGLELEVDTVSVPLLESILDETPPLGPAANSPLRKLNLDRGLVGSTRATFLPMPDDALADAGIREGDLLLIEPIAPEDLEPGDIVVAELAGETTVQRWDVDSGDLDRSGVPNAPVAASRISPPIRRVTAIFRLLRVPPPLGVAYDADADARTHAT
jgi:repressor LexA